jgi:hypothetical protein
MLTIKNIDKVIGMMCYGRDIYHKSNHTNAMGDQSYVFEFDAIQDGQVPKGYNKAQEVHLIRNADEDGCYTLFVMGIALATETKVNEDTIRNKQQLLVEISCCLSNAKQWWDNLNKK